MTKEDYEEETFKKVSKIHKTLPPGHILVFLTGRQEIQVLVERLRMEFKPKVESQKDDSDDESASNESNSGEGESDMEVDHTPVTVLPLYSMLSPEEQAK